MKTVLVIEDEAQTRNIFLQCLEFEGFQAFGAESGVVGMKMAQQHHPDLVVCDIMMPDMDGYSVLQTLRKSSETATIPLIFLTAKVAMADLRRGMELGADDYLTKPCTVEQFLAAINTRLQRQDELSRLYREGLTKPTRAIGDSERADPTSQPRDRSIFPDCPKLAPVFEFIESQYHAAINLKDVAQQVGYSPAYLTNLVQLETGQTVKQWIIARRMAQAKKLLAETKQTIRQIAAASGYNDAAYFARQFRQLYGVSPQGWRQTSVAKLTN
ncbi:response regulator [Nodosilinea sp. LEGE 07088]|uniref:response regulator transcription factor n=1 Tax=Nodosilinea sp. LEGE 07088 TaxID=2777968 RepID=UPI0018813780|nr:response regulator [Nodosilinea sp. LEGE 07088]MBE9139883.1 response regulator [Nodosilinea sp. LEGE 07088]